MSSKAPMPPPRSELLWAAVDLDATLARGIWTPDNPTREIGPPIPENVEKLHALVDRGMKPVIHTSRGWTDYEAIESWLAYHGLPVRRIVCGKLLAGVYVDDRAVHESAAVWG